MRKLRVAVNWVNDKLDIYWLRFCSKAHKESKILSAFGVPKVESFFLKLRIWAICRALGNLVRDLENET